MLAYRRDRAVVVPKKFGKLKRRARRKPKRMLPPTNIQREFYRRLKPRVNKLIELVKKQLIPQLQNIIAYAERNRPIPGKADSARQDASYVDAIQAIFNGMRVQYADAFPDDDLEADANDIAIALSAFNREQVDGVLQSVLSVDVFRSEPWLADELKGFVQQSVSLITTMDDQYFSQLESYVMGAVRAGTDFTTMADYISTRFNVTDNRAKLIARDQVGKANGALTMLRQTDLGVEKYIWRTARDLRVRGNPKGLYPDAEPSHFARENKQFSWDDPPEDGHPGQAINCRCYAEPVLPSAEDLGVEDVA